MADAPSTVKVRMFGLLAAYRTKQGLDTSGEVAIGEEGMTAHDIALALNLPLDLIEGVFCNHTVYGLEHVIHAGDREAFVPHGTPGPHRLVLGLYDAGRGGRS